jgi:precorrin-3B methylase
MGWKEAMAAAENAVSEKLNGMAINDANKAIKENADMVAFIAGGDGPSNGMAATVGHEFGLKRLEHGSVEIVANVSEFGKNLQVTEIVDAQGHQQTAPKVTPAAEGVKIELGGR